MISVHTDEGSTEKHHESHHGEEPQHNADGQAKAPRTLSLPAAAEAPWNSKGRIILRSISHRDLNELGDNQRSQSMAQRLLRSAVEKRLLSTRLRLGASHGKCRFIKQRDAKEKPGEGTMRWI